MLKQYKKKGRKKINFSSILIVISALIFLFAVITGFYAVMQSKRKVDESTLNPKNTELDLPGATNGKNAEGVSAVSEDILNFDIDKIFNQPIAESGKKELTYFDNVSFLGDSITEGLKMYGSGNPFIASEVGVSTGNVITKTYERYNGKTLFEALNEKNSKYIYIMLGANEIGGMDLGLFIKRYEELVNEIKINNPNSIIFIQSITPVTKLYDEKEALLNNKIINEANKLLEKMSKNHSLLFIDINLSLINEDGVLDDEESPNDGIHFGKTSFDKWQNHILTHTIPEIMEDEIIQKQQDIIAVK